MASRKTVLITGSSRGIGRATAMRLAKENMNVIVNYLNSEREAQSLLDEISKFNPNVEIIKADVSEPAQVDVMFNLIERRYGMVDFLVNNAGIAEREFVQKISDESFRKIIMTNLGGCFFCSRRASGPMISKKAGKIINVSSVFGVTGAALESHYSASKGGIIALTKSLAKELSYSGIQVNCIAPGGVDTDMLSGLSEEIIRATLSEIPSGRLASAEEIAEIIAFMLSDKADYFTGQVLSPNGGMDF